MAALKADVSSDIWDAVDALIDRAPSLDDLREHRLQLLAERHWVRAGKSVPEDLVTEKTHAAAVSLPIPSLLSRIRSAWDGRMIILKGPELASRYPGELLRTAGDIDLLVEDARAAQAALCSVGFRLTGNPRIYVESYHLQPLVWSGLPVRIELHHAPKWIEGLHPPSTAELFRFAVPARVGAPGFESLAPAAHVVVLTVHAWAHEPLGRLRDLIDIAVLMTETRVDEIDLLAERWGVSDIWRTTHAVVKSLFAGDARPLALRLWARHLEAARGRTVAESHLAAWMSPFWAFPVAHALRCASTQIADDLRPVPGESWLTKLSRARLAIRDAGVRRSSHDCMLRDAQLATPPAFFLDQIERRREKSSMSDQPRTRDEST